MAHDLSDVDLTDWDEQVSAMRFKGLDLYLPVAFDALMKERGVSCAAVRLHLSQPAMSAALGRLRDYFGGPILAVD